MYGSNTVLLIDDDNIFNTLNKRLLQKHDVEPIKVTTNGQQGIDYMNVAVTLADPVEYPMPVLILLDINMPVMNGWEFLDEYNLSPHLSELSIPILVLTASKNPDDEKMARSYDRVCGYLVKPLDNIAVKNIIDNYLFVGKSGAA